MANNQLEVEELKIIYSEIVNGASPSSDGTMFYKHLTDMESIELTKKFNSLVRENLLRGIPNEEARLKVLLESGDWTQEQEDEIGSFRVSIIENERNLPNIIPMQQPMIRKAIAQDKEKLRDMLVERFSRLGSTAETFAHEDMRFFKFFFICHQDEACTKKSWNSLETLSELPEDQLEAINEDMEKALGKFVEDKLRHLAVMPFFLNTFSYSKDNLTLFFNRPIIRLTQNQLYLFSLGNRNLSILSQATGNPPDLLEHTNIKDIVIWYDLQYSVIQGKRNASK